MVKQTTWGDNTIYAVYSSALMDFSTGYNDFNCKQIQFGWQEKVYNK